MSATPFLWMRADWSARKVKESGRHLNILPRELNWKDLQVKNSSPPERANLPLQSYKRSKQRQKLSQQNELAHPRLLSLRRLRSRQHQPNQSRGCTMRGKTRRNFSDMAKQT